MTTLAPPATIAFLGLGMMGRPMAARLAEAGFKLRLFDISQKAVSDFIGAHPSALATASPKAAAQGADALITMLPDGKIVRKALLGDEGANDGVLDGLASGSLVIDMSSSSPVGTRELGAVLASRGIALVDAPVSGGVKRAIDGSLAIMVGGDDADIARCRPLLAAMGRDIFPTGPLGSGHAMKALNNYVSAAGLTAAVEALAVGEKFGLDPNVMTDVLNASSGRNNTTENKLKQFIISKTFASGFSAALMAKDVRTADELGAAIGVATPLAEACVVLWGEAAARLGATADHTEYGRDMGER